LEKIMGDGVNYRTKPAEDFARLTIDFKTEDGTLAIGEATTSWSFVGAGLRLSGELLGPEYSMSWNTLDSELKLFFSREGKGKSGGDRAFCAGVSEGREAAADFRGWVGSREDPDDGLHGGGVGSDAGVPAPGSREIQTRCRQRHLEAVIEIGSTQTATAPRGSRGTNAEHPDGAT